MIALWILIPLAILIAVVAVYDRAQKQNPILRNYPVIGRFRFVLLDLGPKLRQYIVANNDEERPFSRDQRRWIDDSSKKQNNYFGFGTDNKLETTSNYLIIKPAVFPTHHPEKGEEGYDPEHPIKCNKVLGAARNRKKAFRPDSVLYVSAMSFGSLSSAAVEALNRGCHIADSLHNTGEGGIAPYHDHGAGLIWQLGTGYFGARDDDGNFCMDKLVAGAEEHNVRAIEIKLSQGAKPGRGGVLPAEKISSEIAAIRGIPRDRDCISPPTHSAFSNVDELLDFAESIADATGLPVGIKSAVGQMDFWGELADEMARGERGLDFINIDGGEGGTGAAPLVFADHVALPFKKGFSRVYRVFEERGITDDIVFMGAGRLGFPERALFAFAMGVDMIGVAREAMLSIGCVQAQRCHTDHCPAGIATHNKWLVKGLVPSDKSARLANYLITLRRELMWLSHTVGVDHPSQITLDHFEILDDQYNARHPADVFDYLSRAEKAAQPARKADPVA